MPAMQGAWHQRGDLVRAFNDRGSNTGGRDQRLAPGTVHSYESCSDYQPLGERVIPGFGRMHQHHAQPVSHSALHRHGA